MQLNQHLRERGKLVAQVGVTCACAVALGLLAVKTVGLFEANERKSLRVRQTQMVLTSMGTIQVGDTLPDHWFLADESTTVRLSGAIKGRTLVSFVETTCDACLTELESTAEMPVDLQSRLLFISRNDLNALKAVRKLIPLRSRVLYDPGGLYHERLQVWTFPLSVLIDEQRVILRVVAAPLTKEELLDQIES